MKDNKRHVTQSNALIQAKHNLPSLSKKIFCKAISCLDPLKSKSLEVTFNAKDFSLLFDTNDPHLPLMLLKAADECNHSSIEIKHGDKTIVTRVFHYVELDHKTKDIKIVFSSVLKDELIELSKNFTSYLLENIVNLNNPAYIRLYEILYSKYKLKKYTVSVDDLRILLGTGVKYPLFANFKKSVIEPAQKVLKTKTDISFTFKEIKCAHKVTDLEFTIDYTGEEVIPVDMSDSICITLEEGKPIKTEKVLPINEIWEYFNEKLQKYFNTKLKVLNDKRKREITKALKHYSIEEIQTAIIGFCNDPFEQRKNYLDFQYVNKQFDRFLTMGKEFQNKDKIKSNEDNAEWKKRCEELGI